MTVFGTSLYDPSIKQVTNIDAWANVASIKGSSLPDQGTEPYVFVVWGSFGDVDVTGARNPVRARMEVALGDQNGPFPDSQIFSTLRYPPLFQSAARLRMIPFFYVRGYLSGGRGTWNTANDIAIWVRIGSNGDPVSDVSGASFAIAGIGILAFSLKALGAQEQLHDYFAPASPQANNLAGEGFRTFYQTAVLNWNSGAGDWVVFSATQFLPTDITNAPHYQTTYSPDGSIAAQVGIFGQDDDDSQALRGRQGWMPRTGLDNSQWDHARYSTGGASLLLTPNASAQLGVRGEDHTPVGPTARRSFLRQWEVFAFRADASAPWGGMGLFRYLKINRTTTPSLGKIYSDVNGTNIQEVWEITRTAASKDNVFWNSALRSSQRPSLNQISHVHAISTPRPSIFLADAGWIFRGPSVLEGCHAHVGGIIDRVGLVTQLKFSATQHPSETGAGLDREGGDEFLAFTWVWDNNVDYQPTAVPVPPSEVSIVPGREGPALSALNALPTGVSGERLEPEVTYVEEVELQREEFRASDRTLLTWPRFTVPRRRFGLQWNGLVAADRETLLQFFRDQAQRTWKWTPPRETNEIAVVLVADVSTQDQGLGFSVSTTVLELVWIDP